MKIEVSKITVSDQMAAHRFYVDVLGFKDFVYLPAVQTVILLCPDDERGARLYLEPRSRYGTDYQDQVKNANDWALVIGSKDIAADVARLESKGVKFSLPITETDYGFSATFDDTVGNFIQIYQVKEDIPSLISKD